MLGLNNIKNHYIAMRHKIMRYILCSVCLNFEYSVFGEFIIYMVYIVI